jgi:hypothetical protein
MVRTVILGAFLERAGLDAGVLEKGPGLCGVSLLALTSSQV